MKGEPETSFVSFSTTFGNDAYYANALTHFGILNHSLIRFISQFFYRASLCVNAALAVGWCDGLSVTLLYCIEKDKDIIKHFFSKPGSPLLVFFV